MVNGPKQPIIMIIGAFQWVQFYVSFFLGSVHDMCRHKGRCRQIVLSCTLYFGCYSILITL